MGSRPVNWPSEGRSDHTARARIEAIIDYVLLTPNGGTCDETTGNLLHYFAGIEFDDSLAHSGKSVITLKQRDTFNLVYGTEKLKGISRFPSFQRMDSCRTTTTCSQRSTTAVRDRRACQNRRSHRSCRRRFIPAGAGIGRCGTGTVNHAARLRGIHCAVCLATQTQRIASASGLSCRRRSIEPASVSSLAAFPVPESPERRNPAGE